MTASKLATFLIECGKSSGISDNLSTSIKDARAWQAFWLHHKSDQVPVPPLPEVDFSKEFVILYMLGERSRGSTTVSIESVEDDGNALNVTVAIKISSGISTSAMCNPYTIIKVQADNTRRVNISKRALRPEDIEIQKDIDI